MKGMPENKLQSTSSIVHKGVNTLNLLIYQAQSDPVGSLALMEDSGHQLSEARPPLLILY